MRRQQITSKFGAVTATRANLESRKSLAAICGAPACMLGWSLLLLAAGCAAPRHDVITNTPTSARPTPSATPAAPDGAIFRAANYRPLIQQDHGMFLSGE